MTFATDVEAVGTLQKAKAELEALAATTETEIRTVARAFEGLARHSGAILNLAAALVACVEDESVSTVLPKVQTMGAAAKHFIADRLLATAGILETVTGEVKLLQQLSLVTRGQRAIALETRALSVLTNIEAARLGAVGTGFQFLARELADFSASVSTDIQELASHTESRKTAIEETKRVLSAELPRLQAKLAGIEVDLSDDLAKVDASLTQLSSTPMQFRASMEDITKQIAGVVAAVQAHDITRQQMEHVEEGFTIIAERLREHETSENGTIQDIAPAYAGLLIQIYQLRMIKETVANWASQIRTCMGGILQVSTSEVVGIGPVVLEQEREVSSQLAHIEHLENESQAYSERIQRTLGGLSNLMQLFTEHLQRSKSVRDRLQLLAFNSIVEASRLGVRGAAILAIAKSIDGMSAKWSQITDQSEHAMKDILKLAEHTNQVMATFSESGSQSLREAQVQTRVSLEDLRKAAAFAASQAQQMKAATEKMQAQISEVGGTNDLLDACFGRFDGVLAQVEFLKGRLETDHPGVNSQYDAAQVERLFSASYTTEMERDVLRAALNGGALPVAQPAFGGNSVELF